MIAQLKPSADLGELQQEITLYLFAKCRTREQIFKRFRMWGEFPIGQAIEHLLYKGDIFTKETSPGIPKYLINRNLKKELMARIEPKPVQEKKPKLSIIEKWAQEQIENGIDPEAHEWLIAYSRTFKSCGTGDPLIWISKQINAVSDGVQAIKRDRNELLARKSTAQDFKEIRAIEVKAEKLLRAIERKGHVLNCLKWIRRLHY